MKQFDLKPADWIKEIIAKEINSFYQVKNGFIEYYNIESKSFNKMPGQDGFIILKNVHDLPVGDKTLSAKEIIGNESQERMGLVIHPKDLNKLKEICERENAPIYVVGKVKENKRFLVKSKKL